MTTPATSALDNRRTKSSTANAAAEKARAGVTELDHRLQTNANLIEQQTQALRHAESEAKRLKRALKLADTERARLAKQRAKAAARASKAQAKAEAAEAKYDQVVLAELVKREKARDRAEATAARGTASAPSQNTAGPNTAGQSTAGAARNTAGRTAGAPARTTAAEDSPATQNGPAASTLATATAAKTTAAKATAAKSQPSPRTRGANLDPPPEKPDPGTAEAVKTAARRTRRAAR
ncbi:hypothetical protein [Jidongwangia harbinensis]|uniref:hypothetical protein n=1 Tax=Jidongwangia harbinensis TaxID=2878561 RepID=UPI001CD92474|nr:hypothetical protein [Jidongwangia harbinensis]MCA2214393.1 hypothetical protein [Jidongwangia harbinensis]